MRNIETLELVTMAIINNLNQWSDTATNIAMELSNYGLQRLFRDPIEQLPIDEQLKYYHQRDLFPSYFYRLGTRVFKIQPSQRRRVFEASLYSPAQRTPHAHPTNYVTAPRQECIQQQIKEDKKPSELSEEELREWVQRRQELRCGLEGMGINEQWLCSKDRTPAEDRVFAQLRAKGATKVIDKESCTDMVRQKLYTPSISPSLCVCVCVCYILHSSLQKPHLEPVKVPTAQELRRAELKLKKELHKEVSLLEKFITSSRLRLAQLLVSQDTTRDHLISTETLTAIMNKLKAPVGDMFGKVCIALMKETNNNGLIDYQLLLRGNLAVLVEKHLTDDELMERPKSVPTGSGEGLLGVATTGEPSSSTGIISTMEGDCGVWAKEFKEEAFRQFQKLMEYCKSNDIMMDKELAKRGVY